MARSKKKRNVRAAPYEATTIDDKKWRARSAYDTLQRADEHRRDPGLMREVRSHAKQQAKAAMRIAKMEKADGSV